MNWIGFAAAAATFLGIWLGHVSVRKLEREVERIWIPATIAFALGVGLELASLWTDSLVVAAMCGILGVTLLWDSLELAVRQPNRIKHGHAPANPNNRRHARILAEHPQATTIDWLNREPRGRPYAAEEIKAIQERRK